VGAVLVPFVEDQAGRRHQVNEVMMLRSSRGEGHGNIRESHIILRPQAVNHEGIGPFALDL
jgi:hypothetical protein